MLLIFRFIHIVKHFGQPQFVCECADLKHDHEVVRILTTVLFSLITSQFCCCCCCFLIQQVIPKAEILRLGVLEQSKEEVIVQVGI